MSRLPGERHEPGTPGTPGFIPLSAPQIAGNEWAYLKECLDTGWVSSVGPFVDRFEREVAQYVGARSAVAMVNGTAALHLALKVVGVQCDDEVLVSNLTFVAPVNAIRYCQAHPVFIDAHPDTWQIDPDKLARFLVDHCDLRGDGCHNRTTGRRVRAILPVHILGLACEIDRIAALAAEYDLRLVEDACEALGVRYRGRQVGTFGDVGVLSFNGNKIISTGGGGMLVTNDTARAEYASYLTKQAKDDPVEYVHNEVGYNYRLTNVQAALGVAQLEQIETFVAKKRWIAETYARALGDIEGITLMPTPAHTEPTYWLYTCLLGADDTLARRKALVRALNTHGVGARPLWHPVHELPPYRDCQAFEIEHSTNLYRRAVSLPSSVGITEDQVLRCVDVLTDCLSREALA